MLRLAVLFAFMALVLGGQAQVFSHGAPASVVSPEADGRVHGVPASVVSPGPDGSLHGVPASVLSPTPLPFGVNPPPPPFVFAPRIPHHPPRRFGARGRGHHQNNNNLLFVPVPLFYPTYADAAYPVADPNVQASVDPAEQAPATTASDPAPAVNGSAMSAEDALRAAYLQGARDALTQQQNDPRYGGHYLDSRERTATAESGAARRRQADASDATAPAPAKESDWPATVFIFKDGHQIETRNFAIMGETLFDFSGQTLKKVQLADLDKEATVKANDDRGIQVKLP